MKRVIVVVVVGFTPVLSHTIGEETSGIEYAYAGEWHDCPEYAFSSPGRIAVAPTGEVFVVDENLGRLTEWTGCGSYKRAWKHLGESEGSSGFGYGPGEITVGPGGDLYTACGKEVWRYAADGTFLSKWFVTADENSPEVGAIAAGSGGDVYVLLPQERRVRYFTPEGMLLGEWVVLGHTTSEIYTLRDIAVSPNTGFVYVADGGGACVRYFTSAGSFLGQWGKPGSDPGQFGDSLNLAVGPDGTVFVADADNDRVQYFTATGSYLGLVGHTRDGYQRMELEYPAGVAVTPNGYVYVTDLNLDRVFYFEPRAAGGK